MNSQMSDDRFMSGKQIIEPRHAKSKAQISFAVYREVDQRLCFRYIDSTIQLLPKSEISSI